MFDHGKPFWVWGVAAAAAVYVVISYFATSEAVRKIDCESERRAIVSKQRASVVILNSERIAASNQQVTLLRIQAIVMDLRDKNPQDKLNLSGLRMEIERLVDASKLTQTQKEEAYNKASKELEAAEDEVFRCGGQK